MSPATIDHTLDQLAINTVKFLAVDAVEQANSGHPGLPMGAADVAYVLWSRYLRHDPTAPDWADRDRFVLSAGHGCMLLYALLHLSGYPLSLEDIKQFRQWGSKTPGHPEFGHTVGVEATTGPLGQGISNAVGIALAGEMLAARVNGGSGFQPVGQRTFVLCSDGDLMEGISGEACSLAGHLGLGRLIALYDDNHITIEGDTDLAFSEDVCKRYEAFGWQVQRVDGHDHEQIAEAIEAAIAASDRPSLIACRTKIAKGSPNKEATADAHGSPLGPEETEATKKALGWPTDKPFHVPDEVRAFFAEKAKHGKQLRESWQKDFDAWRATDTDKARAWDEAYRNQAPEGLTDRLLADAPTGDDATRKHSGAVLQQVAKHIPALVGGSADLAPSNKSDIKGADAINTGNFSGRNLHFGVREHAMGAMVNGMLYHGAFRPYGATFLVFSDYVRPAIRLAALSKLPAIYIFTHDSIFVGEDGPTHEPVEHAFALRSIPDCDVWRPADGYETALSWGMALERTDGPSTLLFTRQKIPAVDRQVQGELADPRKGAYLVQGDDNPDAIVAATGSELQLAIAAREHFASKGKKLNVVSVPCLDLFLRQPQSYRDRLFPAGTKVATIEAGITWPWACIAGRDGLTIGIDRYGASAPWTVLQEKFGFTPEAVNAKLEAWLA